VEHVDLFLFLQNPVDDPVDMRLTAVEQVFETTVFRRYRAAVGSIAQCANRVPESAIPGVRRLEERAPIQS
jgi:hypothetical protein